MNNDDFRFLLDRAIDGNVIAIGEILHLYEPLIKKYSYIYGKFDEDLYQELMGMIFRKIHKFKIDTDK